MPMLSETDRAFKPLLLGAASADDALSVGFTPGEEGLKGPFSLCQRSGSDNESRLCIEAPQERPAIRTPLMRAEQTVGRSAQAVWFVTPERHTALGATALELGAAGAEEDSSLEKWETTPVTPCRTYEQLTEKAS